MEDDLADQLAVLPEDELLRFAARYDQLTDDAQTLVRAEFKRRRLDPPLIEDDLQLESRSLVTVRQHLDNNVNSRLGCHL